MRKLLLVIATMGVVGITGCTKSSNETAPPNPTSKLDTLVLQDDNFTFATRRQVELRLEPNSTEVAVPVVISDAQGRRLYKGAVRQAVALDFKIANGSANALTVVTGRGDTQKTQTVELQGGRGVARF